MEPIETACLRPLLDALVAILRRHPAGLSEYQLIQALEREVGGSITRAGLRDPLTLYRTHFLLFHYLYRLRARLRSCGEELEIHCLRIVLRAPSASAPGQLEAHDPLAEFYLDLSNLNGVSGEQVQELLTGFWRWFRGRDQRQAALAVLDLEDPVDTATIKRQYRRLVMRHHPDRGGDTASIQRLNEALAMLQD